jgi:hypothetical protein
MNTAITLFSALKIKPVKFRALGGEFDGGGGQFYHAGKENK